MNASKIIKNMKDVSVRMGRLNYGPALNANDATYDMVYNSVLRALGNGEGDREASHWRAAIRKCQTTLNQANEIEAAIQAAYRVHARLGATNG